MNNFELYEKLKNEGVIQAFEIIGANIDEVFKSDETDFEEYSKYSWGVHYHCLEGLKGSFVIHAIPPASELDQNAWEEWFCLNDDIYHICLYTSENEKTDQTVVIDKNDNDHPIVVRDRKWFYYQNSSLQALL